MPYNLNIPGWMTERELIILEKLASGVPPGGLIVEVGSMFGRSAYCFAATAPNAEVYCIDYFYENYYTQHNISYEQSIKNNFPISNKTYNLRKEFISNTRHLNNINMVLGSSPEVAPNFNKEIDLFFLDASHTNPSDWKNLCYFIPLVKLGGIVCGHDYNYSYPDVMANAQKISDITNQPIVTYAGTSIWSIVIPKKIEKLELC